MQKTKRKKLRVGVIGLGMGQAHVRGFQKSPHADVVAVADVDAERLERVANKLEVPGLYLDAQEMLDDAELDIVSVATPNTFHKPLTIAALEAGCHVLCEKPMAMNAGEAQDMIDAAERAGTRLMINFSFRFNPTSFALRRLVDAGTFGHIYYGRTTWLRRRGMPKFGGWFGRKALAGGGPLIDLGVHRLDLALWLMDYPKPVWVMGNTYDFIASRKAKAAGVEYDVEDLASALIRFENGASLALEASWAGNIRERERMCTELLGTEGGFRQNNVGEGYEFETEVYLEKDGDLLDMTLHPPFPPCPSAMHHFAEAIVTDTPHMATAENGLYVMKILDAIYQSADKGEPIPITID